MEGEGRWPVHTLLMQGLTLTLSLGPCPQVVVLNGCSSVFASLAMVLCDPGGKLAGSLCLFWHVGRDTQALGLGREDC